jgi:hypothetical protein
LKQLVELLLKLVVTEYIHLILLALLQPQEQLLVLTI